MARAFSPLDEELQLWPGGCSPTLADAAAHLGAWVPFERLPDLLRRLTGTLVPASTIQRITETAGAAAEALQTQAVERLERETPLPPAGPATLQLSIDGVMVPLRGKGEWAEVKTLAVGEVQPAVVTAQGERQIPVTALSYFSRLTDAQTFGRLATVETQRRGVETAGVVAAVVDGAEWCQGFIDLHRPDAVRILDFPHAAEYLAQVAQVAYGAGTVRATDWLATQCHTLKHLAPGLVLDAVRTVRDTVACREDPAALALVDTSLAYLEKRQAQLAYATFQAQGLPIGSGIVESANKVVVEARLKGAGMHWRRDHVNPLLALRTLVCSNRWDDTWPAIVRQMRTQQRATAAQRRQARHSRQAQLLAPVIAGPVASATTPPTDLLPPASAPTPPDPSLTPVPPGTTLCTAPPTAPKSTPVTPRRPNATHPWRRYPAVRPKHDAA